jgi:anti-sigma factor RsiW
MSCQELVEVVTDYLDGTMDTRDRERLEAHLATCDGCQNVIAQFRLVIAMSGHLTEDRVSQEQRDTLREVFRRWRAGK